MTVCRRWIGSSGFVATLLLCLPAIGLAQQIAIGEYPLPTSEPQGIADGPDGALWFAEYDSGQIGRITVAGSVNEYAIPTSDSGPKGITAGPDGALWFTEYGGNKIGRITTAGTITEYAIPGSNSVPTGITTGSDGALWFAEFNGKGIGRITTSGQITQYIGLTGNPQWIAAGPDGALWFTESTGNIGRITTAGQLTFYPVPTANSDPYGITSGPDGALWFTEDSGNNIGRITTTGAITEYAVPTPNSAPHGITAGPDGALWFTEASNGGKIGRITTAGAISEFSTPTANKRPWGIALGPDGELWFTCLGKIGEALFVTANLSATPATGSYQTEIVFNGSAFAPNETVQIYTSGVGSAVLASATADSDGAFTATAHAPVSPYGPRLFQGLGQSSGNLGAASFSMNPRLALSPASGPVGTTVMAAGYGFVPFEQVTLYWNSPRILLGVVNANFAGSFNGDAALTFIVPNGSPSGPNAVAGSGGKTKPRGYGSFTVE